MRPGFFMMRLPPLLLQFCRCAVVAALFAAGLRAGAAVEWTSAPVQFTADDHSAAEIRFTIQNSSDIPLTITRVDTSCGCTVAETPPQPWIIAPQAKGAFVARVDLRGKRGELHKTIWVTTSAGEVTLPVKIRIPESPMTEDRRKNQLIALADARAVFQGDCARCHVAPALGKTGPELYQAACAICHEAHPRAEVVPDLSETTKGWTAEALRTVIAAGKTGTLMPPFAQEQGGPLDAAQVESLVAFLRHGASSSDVP
jgi:mono/diheme cytochrome c family protein